ncbi:sensor histidine kinase [Streptosporangium sp. NPDC087985]|uniref:sensor histidine kinase n=1 Tax=Streptosporangium sp. NPDC087985 TaxID=3366196 RepID=UPI00381449CE
MWRVDPLAERIPAVLVLFMASGLGLVVAGLVRERRVLLRRLRCEQARLAEQQDALARAVLTEERSRIAHELHDVVAHGISMMTLGVGAGRMIMERDPARAREILRLAEKSGRQALLELQRMLCLLKTEDSPGSRAPQPKLSDLADLLVQVRKAGLRVDMTEDGSPVEIGLALELSVYRIVQEALGNTLGRARARSAHVILRWRPGFLDVLVRDDGQAAAATTTGHRLLRMRERAMLFGGTLEAEVRPEGGVEVRARLPTVG